MNLGKEIKKVRKNRTYSQTEVARDITSQSTYSKFENGRRDIDACIYLQLLQRLDVTADEFDYIRNGFNYGRKSQLIHALFSMNYNHIGELHKLKKQAAKCLEEQYDKKLKYVYLICEALIQLHDTKDVEIAQSVVKPIWKYMSKYEQWYLSDIRIINVILFLFPVDTAIEITQTVLTRLTTYKDFQDAVRLKMTFKINLSLLLIKNKDYANALTVISDSLQCDRKRMSYSLLALHFSREAICRANLQKEGLAELLVKAEQLLLLYEDNDYWERIHQEFNYYTSIEWNQNYEIPKR